MTVEQQVRAAVDRGKPGEALLILARAIDSMAEDDWTIPTPSDDPPTDPDEFRAWEARQRLAQDAGKVTADVGVLRSELVTIDAGNGETTIMVPPAPDHVQKMRADAGVVDFDTVEWSDPALKLNPTLAWESYVMGGPLWLHAYDREMVLQLPEETRREMVRDVMQYAPDDAHALARDILKDPNPGDPPA